MNDFPSSVGKICDVDLRDKFGRTPLMFAALADYPDCAEVLLRLGCQKAKFDPFPSLDCARVEGVGVESKERKGSNFAV